VQKDTFCCPFCTPFLVVPETLSVLLPRLLKLYSLRASALRRNRFESHIDDCHVNLRNQDRGEQTRTLRFWFWVLVVAVVA
jgi:hypothetical protein